MNLGKGVLGLAGTGFALVGLYLLLKNSKGATNIFGSLFGGYVKVVRALQGR